MGCTNYGNQQQKFYQQIRTNKLRTIDCRRKSSNVGQHIIENLNIRQEALQPFQLVQIQQYLCQHEIFQSLSYDQINKISQEIVYGSCPQGEYLFQEEDQGNCFFAIAKGRVSVEIEKKQIRVLEKGSTFGQIALLYRTKRTASIKCLDKENQFYVLKPKSYRNLLEKYRRIQYQRSNLIIDSVSMFKSLSDKQRNMISASLRFVHFKANQVIFNQDDITLQFFIIEKGKVKIQIKGKQDIYLGNMESFGEKGLLQNQKRSGIAIAETQTYCAFLRKDDIQRSLGCNYTKIMYYNTIKWALKRSKYFKMLDRTNLHKMIISFTHKQCKNNQIILDGVPDKLYISLKGSINDKDSTNIFGENQWKYKSNTRQKLLKSGDGYYAWISYSNVNAIMGTSVQNNIQISPKDTTNKQNHAPMCLEKFLYLKKLGQGQFGQVYLVRNPVDNTLYALKCLQRQKIEEQEMQNSVIQEKQILQHLNHPLIVGYKNAFEDKKNIYLLMEYLHGQQMFDVIRDIGYMNKSIVCYYFGSLLLSLQYLHSLDIIYRDIKPENAVVNHHGKVYLIDLGTGKFLKKTKCFRTFTIIGTPHYMAPEVFEGKGYSFQSDAWSMGVLLYEFICGTLPFGDQLDASNAFQLYSVIKKGMLTYPPSLDENAKEVMNALMTKNPRQRAINANWNKIKKMKYFEDVDWQGINFGNITCQYIPKQTHEYEYFQKVKGQPVLDWLYKKQKPKNYEIHEWNGSFV